MEELNKKIAEWAGFKFVEEVTEHLGGGREEITPCYWNYPDGDWGYLLPDFTDPVWGIAYCFKYVVPKIASWRVVLYQNDAGGVTSYIDSACKCGMWEETLSFAETPALAFCLAVEKLIDSKEGK